MGFFEKLKQGLSKTASSISSVFTASELDDEFYDDLEESLIVSDLGMDTTEAVMDRLRQTAKEQRIKTVDEAKLALRGILADMLNVGDPALKLDTKPSVILVIGVNGVGKTTTIGKLAHQLHDQGKKVLLCAGDTFRAAAADQLEIWSERAHCDIIRQHEGADPASVVFDAIAAARARGSDVIICDTAGRLHVDETLMDELKAVKAAVNPDEILLVVDAMTGQDAVSAAKTFDEYLDITGVMLSKLDGDARGGAALSIKAVTGKPIKFIGTGEKLDQIEPFHPGRMASRILGMGDMLTLIEKAEAAFDAKKAAELEQKLKSNKFTLSDFYDQLSQLKNMGSLDEIAAMMPGMNAGALKGAQVDEKAMARTAAIIQSMTPLERENPSILNASRKKRIAAGCGMQVSDVNRLLKSFEMLQQLTKSISKGRFGGFGGPGGMPTLGKAKKGKLQGFGRKKRLK